MANLIAPPIDSPGDWRITWSSLRNAPTGVTETEDQDALIAAAVAACWHLTGRQYGRHTSGAMIACLRCPHWGRSHACGCRWYDSIDLDPSGGPSDWPHAAPVLAINAVTLDGTDLTPGTDYGVRNNRWLDRLPYKTRWPTCIDYAADPPRLTVDWDYGLMPPDDLIINGVGELVDDLWKAWTHQPCQLDPSIVQSVQREGISFALISPGQAWAKGYTGNAQVDAACVRAWPDGPAVTKHAEVFDPVDLLRGPNMVRFERPTA